MTVVSSRRETLQISEKRTQNKQKLLKELVGKYDKSFVANTTITFEITATLTGLHHQHVSLSSRFVYLNLPKLTSLKLRECGIKSLGVDFSLPNLLVLDLNGNSLTRLSLPPSSNSGGRWKDRLPRLQRLLAARNNIGRMDDLFELAELSGLVHLELLGNPICMDRNQLNRQLIENVATTIHSATANEPSNISGKEERSIISEEFCRLFCCYHLPSLQQFNHLPITNHERQLAVQRFAQQEAHRLREKLLVAETAAHNLLRQMADSQGLVEAKQAEMEDIRCDLVAAKQLCQQLAKQMISKNKVLAEQIRLNDDLELKLAETLRAPSEKKADQSQQSTTGSLLKRIDTDELTQKNRELESLLASKDEEVEILKRQMDRLKFEEQTATSAAAVTTGIQQIDIAVETDSAELLQNLLLDAMTAAVTGSTDPVDKLQQTLTGAFSHFKNMIAAREEDRYNEWQTERELLEAEIQTLRELMQAKDQRLKFYVSRALFQ